MPDTQNGCSKEQGYQTAQIAQELIQGVDPGFGNEQGVLGIGEIHRDRAVIGRRHLGVGGQCVAALSARAIALVVASREVEEIPVVEKVAVQTAAEVGGVTGFDPTLGVVKGAV